MINLFPPGAIGASSVQVYELDVMSPEPTQELHDKHLEDYFKGEKLPTEHHKLFVAFAELYSTPSHLETVAMYYDFIDWDSMRSAILELNFLVPDVRTPTGLIEARRMLLT